MRRLSLSWEALFQGGIWGWLVISGGVLAIVSGLFAHFRMRRATDEMRAAALAFLPTTFFLLSMTATSCAVMQSIRAARGGLTGTSHELHHLLGFYIELLRWTAIVLVVVPPVLVLVARTAASARWREAEHPRWRWGVLVPPMAVGIITLWHLPLFDIGFHDAPMGMDRAAYFSSLVQGGGRSLSGARVVLVVLGLLFVLGFEVHRRRPALTPVQPLVSWGVGVAILLFGASAYSSTRYFAADARHPLSAWRTSASVHEVGSVSDLPALPRCDDEIRPESAPVVRFEGSAVGVFHLAPYDESTSVVVGTPRDLVLELERVKREWSILHPSEPFEARVAFEAPRDMSLAHLEPWLEAANRAGYSQLVIASRERRTVSTRTVGDIERERYCALSLPADRDFTTWGDLAQSL